MAAPPSLSPPASLSSSEGGAVITNSESPLYFLDCAVCDGLCVGHSDEEFVTRDESVDWEQVVTRLDEGDEPLATPDEEGGGSGQTARSSKPDLSLGDFPAVEQSVVVGAKHYNVVQNVGSALFPGDNVGDVTRRLIPTTNGAKVLQFSPHRNTERVLVSVNPQTRASTGHKAAMPDSSAFVTANNGCGSDTAVEHEVSPADLTKRTLLGLFSGALSAAGQTPTFCRTKIPVSVGAGREFFMANGACERFDSTDGDETHVDESSREDAIWKQAYISDLPNSAFLYIEPGGEVDGAGKTVPRSLRHFPVRDAEGRLDLPHVRAAIDMAPKAKLPASVIAHVQERARNLLAERGGHHHAANMDAGEETREDVTYFDASKLRRTEQGGVKVPGAPTKVGVFRYRRQDGTTVREYRPAEEVFAADSLASLEDAPVTDLHPAVMVSAENFKTLSKGHVRDVKRDGFHAAADVVVQDADLANKVLRRERTDMSCGYRCKLDATPGVFNGQPYDVIQRNIRYNHVALLPRGTGRQGTDVALRFDACQDNTIMVIRFDGKDYDLTDPVAQKAYEAAVIASAQAAAKAEAEKLVTFEKNRADTAEGERDQARAELAPLKAEKAAAERKALETRARKVLGADVKFDGLTDRQVMEKALKADCTGKSDEYVRGRFDAVEPPATSVATDPALLAGFNALQPQNGGTQPNGTLVPNPLTTRWQEPLTASKQARK